MKQVYQHLTSRGFSVWTDEGLRIGTPDWQAAIEEEIAKAKGLVVILSPSAHKSNWVRREINRAQNLNIPVYPLLSGGNKKNSVPLSLETAQLEDIRKNIKLGLNKLTDTLEINIGEKTSKEQKTTTEIVDNEELKLINIEDWVYPLEGFKTIPFGRSITNRVLEPYSMPRKKPLFGGDSIPFELNLQGKYSLLECVEVEPKHPTDRTSSPEIEPGSPNAIAAYLLIRAGKGFRIKDNVEFEGKRIGYLEFSFDDGEPYIYDLVLGQNIRDGSYKHPDVVSTISDPNILQVWHTQDDTQTLDMLRVDFPNPPRNITSFRFVAECKDVKTTYTDFLPRIQVCGLTYKTQKIAEVSKPSKEEDSVLVNNLDKLVKAAAILDKEEKMAEALRIREEDKRQKREQLGKKGKEIFYELFKDFEVVAKKFAPNIKRSLIKRSKIHIGLGSASLEAYLMNNGRVVGEDRFKESEWDVVLGAVIEVLQNKEPPYTWGANLWFANIKDGNGYQWWEVSYMYTPLINYRSENEPFAVGKIKLAEIAAAPGINEIQFASHLRIVDDENKSEFIIRWCELLADASQGQLRHPMKLPLDY